MSPGSLGALGTHLRLYVDEYAEGHRNAHPSNKSTYATKRDNIHHVGMIRCWIGGRQTAVRIPAVRAVKLAYSKDQAEHSALWRFAKNVDVELRDSEADVWKRRDTTITVAWWDQRVREVMTGRTTTTAVIRESRARAGVGGVGKVVVPADEDDVGAVDDEVEFGEWNAQLEARPMVQHGDFNAGHRIRGVSNEIGHTSTGSAHDMITVKRTAQRRPLRSTGPADDLDASDPRPRTRKRAESVVTEYTETSEYDDSDVPAAKQRRAPPPAPFTLNVDVFGKFVLVPVTPYSTLGDVVAAATARSDVGIRGSEPLVRVDKSSFLLIDEWCQEWDARIWSRIKEKTAFLPQPVVWSCELVETRRKKKNVPGRA